MLNSILHFAAWREYRRAVRRTVRVLLEGFEEDEFREFTCDNLISQIENVTGPLKPTARAMLISRIENRKTPCFAGSVPIARLSADKIVVYCDRGGWFIQETASGEYALAPTYPPSLADEVVMYSHAPRLSSATS